MVTSLTVWQYEECLNTLRPRQDGCLFPDHMKCTILIKISLTFVPKAPINNIPALVQIMAWRRPGDKPLSEPMMVSLLTHICITRPQWVNANEASLKNMNKWQTPYESTENYWYYHNKTKHTKAMCIFYGIYCEGGTQGPFYQHGLIGTRACINNYMHCLHMGCNYCFMP